MATAEIAGFDARWLTLREPADHAARNPDVAAALAARMAGADTARVLDLGCGTGSNLRGTCHLLPARQDWTLVDHDPALLGKAREVLAAWADQAAETTSGLRLAKGSRDITVSFRRADLTEGVLPLMDPVPDLITASALFDLISVDWMETFADDLALHRVPLYAVLTFDGAMRIDPSQADDAAVFAAFAEDMRRDKGFGPAAGGEACRELHRVFDRWGFDITMGASPWVLPAGSLASELLTGVAQAVRGRLPEGVAEGWLAARAAAPRVVVGHTDILCWPA
jgi:SAM-dependent methyltransferase